MKMKPPSGPKKQTQNKANFFKGQNELKIACQKIRPHPNSPGAAFFLELLYPWCRLTSVC